MARDSVTVPKTDDEVAAAAGIEPRQPGETDEQYAERLADALSGSGDDDEDGDGDGSTDPAGGPQPPEEPEPVDYSTWSKAQLVDELVARGLPKGGNVATLVARLVEADGVPTDVDETRPEQPDADQGVAVKHRVLHSIFRYTDDTHRRVLREGESAAGIPAEALARGIAVGAIAKD